MLVSINAISCSMKNSRLIKNEEAKGLLSKSGIRNSFKNLSLIADVLFLRCAASF